MSSTRRWRLFGKRREHKHPSKLQPSETPEPNLGACCTCTLKTLAVESAVSRTPSQAWNQRARVLLQLWYSRDACWHAEPRLSVGSYVTLKLQKCVTDLDKFYMRWAVEHERARSVIKLFQYRWIRRWDVVSTSGFQNKVVLKRNNKRFSKYLQKFFYLESTVTTFVLGNNFNPRPKTLNLCQRRRSLK